MVRMFVRHRIGDYATWKAAYDSLEPARLEAGAAGHEIFRTLDDESDLTVWHDFTDRATAQAFAAAPALGEAMRRAGVEGAPEIWFASPAE